MLSRALPVLAALLLASCGSTGLHLPELKPYRMEIQQGNFVTQDMVSRLKPGMSKDQVRFILGTPLITDTFHADRWDYVFRRQRANSDFLEHRKIAVYFEDGKLKRVEGDVKTVADPAKTVAAEDRAANAEKPQASAPAPATEDKPQDKSWWQKLKDMF